MKKIFYILIAAVTFAQCTPKAADKISTPEVSPIPKAETTTTSGNLDRSIPPKPGAAPKIQIGDYETFNLDNGVEVIVVQNDKLPRVSFQLSVDVDPMLEGDKAGVVDLTGQLMRRGTKNRTKQEIDEEVDFIGGALSTSGRGVYGSSLSKHQDKLLELMSDVLLNPTFEGSELEKLKKETISGLASQKDSPDAIAGNVASVLNFSKNHPYGEIVTEETVSNVTRKDCKKYFDTYFKPNTTRLVVVGDVDAKALKGQLETYFGKWKEGDVPANEYDMPAFPKASEVAFVDKAGAVQSVVRVTYPVDLKPGSKDAIAARVMNTILGGGGFSGYLMQNLREDKAYTYGAYSSLRSSELVGSFSASASVRNEVTDSAVTEFLYEMNRIGTEKVDEDKLKMVLNKMTGSFARSLERPQTVASFASNIARYNLPKDYYQTYLEKLNAITPEDIQRVAKKYVRPDQANILVVGNKDEVADKLKKFSKSGEVTFYDNDGNKLEASKTVVPKDMTAEQVVAKYIEATGGKNWDKVQDISSKVELSMMGQTFDGQIMQQAPSQMMIEITAKGQVLQKIVFNGTKGMVSGMMGSQAIEGDDAKSMKNKATINLESKYAELGYELTLKGIEKIEGSDAYKIAITSPTGEKSVEYYDVKSALKVRSISSETTPQGEMTTVTDYFDYTKVGDVMMPLRTKETGPQTVETKLTDVKINEGLPEGTFEIKE